MIARPRQPDPDHRIGSHRTSTRSESHVHPIPESSLRPRRVRAPHVRSPARVLRRHLLRRRRRRVRQQPRLRRPPWATIQKAATVAATGDTVNIRAGIYRETVTPANSGTSGNPIVYQPDGNATVVVSGADTADGGWSVHSGSIYKKAITLPVTGYNDHITSNTTLLANQVFVAGKMMIEARWPNVANSDDLLDRNDFRRTTFGTWTNTSGNDSGIPNIPDSNGWAGGTLWMNGWYMSRTRTIALHSGSQITWTESFGDSNGKRRQYYYLTGKLGALDAEKEWFCDGTHLYFRAPGSTSPANVEVKMRNWAFNLNGRSHINNQEPAHLCRLDCHERQQCRHHARRAARQNTSTTVSRCPTASMRRTVYADPLFSHTEETGIRLMGQNSVIRNSIVEYSSDQGIVLGGGLALDLHDEALRATAVGAIIQRWTRLEPLAAAEWIVQLPPGPTQTAAVENLVATWGNRAPEEVEQWLDSVVASRLFEPATRAFVAHLASREPSALERWRTSAIRSPSPETAPAAPAR